MLQLACSMRLVATPRFKNSFFKISVNTFSFSNLAYMHDGSSYDEV